MSPEKTPVVADTQVAETKKMNRELGYFYLFVASVVACSWIFGALGLSFIWTLGLIAILFSIWRTKLFNLIRRILDLEQLSIHRKRALRQNETTEWLNFLFNRWWVFSSSSIQDLIKRRLDERMLNIKPNFLKQIELSTFTLGTNTPSIRHVRVFSMQKEFPGVLKLLHGWMSRNHLQVWRINLNSKLSWKLMLTCSVRTFGWFSKFLLEGKT